MGEPIYGVEVTYQSGRVSVKSVYLEKDYSDTFFRMASSLIGRADPVDGVASVRLVKCNPVWEECVEEEKITDLSDLAGLFAANNEEDIRVVDAGGFKGIINDKSVFDEPPGTPEDPHFDVVVPLLLSVDGEASETPEAEADDDCVTCKGTGRKPSTTGVPMIGATDCDGCLGTGKRPVFSDLAATVRNRPANRGRPQVKDSCKNLVDHMQHKCVCYKVDL